MLPERPSLKLAYICDKGPSADRPVLAFPDAVQSRFLGNDSIIRKWESFLKKHTTTYGTPFTGKPGKNPTEPAVNESVDLSVDGPTGDQVTVALHDPANAKDPEEFSDNVIVSVPLASNRKINVVVAKSVEDDDTIELWLDGSGLTTDSLVLPKHVTVLCGFGCGEWKANEPGIEFRIHSDCDVHTLVSSDGSKHTGMLCSLLREMQTKSGKTAKVSYHVKEQLTTDDGTPVNHRWKFTQKKRLSSFRILFQKTVSNHCRSRKSAATIGTSMISFLLTMPLFNSSWKPSRTRILR